MIRTGTEERPCEDGDRRAPSTCQGGRPQGKLKRQTLDLWILSSWTARKLTSVVLSTLFVVLGYGSPIKLTQSLVMIVVTPSFPKAINGYVWFPGGVFSKWNCCYYLLSWTFSFFSFFLCLLLLYWHGFESVLILSSLTILTLYPLTTQSLLQEFHITFIFNHHLWFFSLFVFFSVFLFVVLLWFWGWLCFSFCCCCCFGGQGSGYTAQLVASQFFD